MTALLAAAALPLLLWDKGPETASQITGSSLKSIAVPLAQSEAWRQQNTGLTIQPLDPARLASLPAPALTYDSHSASATRAPWVHLNGWRFLRDPEAHFLYRTNGSGAALAAAEAFSYAGNAVVETDDAGLEPFSRMLAFLRTLPPPTAALPRANIGYLDDGSPQSAEFMNMLVRRNLLFMVVAKPNPAFDLNVALGEPDYPPAELANPKLLAEKVRANLTDEKRLLRIYGSEVVVGRLIGDPNNARLFVLNYGAAKQPVAGLRVRVLGRYHHFHVYADSQPDCSLQDVNADNTAAEFTLPRLSTLAVVDLSP